MSDLIGFAMEYQTLKEKLAKAEFVINAIIPVIDLCLVQGSNENWNDIKILLKDLKQQLIAVHPTNMVNLKK